VLQGLIVTSRKETLQPFKKRYAHEHEPVKDLLGAIKVQGWTKGDTNRLPLWIFMVHKSFSIFQVIRPTALIGSAGVGQSFTKEVIEAMSSINEVTLNITSLSR
jgi:malate dehydrogenase (oxaloacetate-decarboxylating)(NADP+)